MYGPRPRLAAFWLGLLKPSSQQQYLVALRLFADWAAVMYPSFWVLSEEEQDFALSEYALECQDNDDCGVQLLSTTVAAVSRAYGRRRRFTAASLTVEGWKAGLAIKQAPPMSSVVTYAHVALLTAAQRLEEAAAVLVCFTGVMRISEVLSLVMGDVLLPSQHQMGQYVVILLRFGKRGAPDATRIVIGLPLVVRWITLYKNRVCAGRKSDERFCSISYTTFRKWLRRASVALGFEGSFFTSHSMRRGGATEMVRSGVPVLDTMQYGRWASYSSFRIYVAKGDVLLTRFLQRLSDEEWLRLEAVARLTLVALERAAACASP